MSEFRITDRDKKIIREIDRWRVCQGRHLMYLAGFDGQRACDRRLHKLIEMGYVSRKRIIYGIAGIYKNTSRVRPFSHVSNEKIRIEHLKHDIMVLDTAIYYNKQGIPFDDIVTEKELHMRDGFGLRKHKPDFIFTKGNQTICVEVELALKSKVRFLNIIKNNFMDYDTQIWVVPSHNSKIARILKENQTAYPNIDIVEVKEIQDDE